MARALFLSDAHLGAEPAGALPGREALLERYLLSWRGRLDRLYVLGDLFEFWTEYGDVVPRCGSGVVAAMALLVREGTEVHLFAGNHDYDVGRHFESLGIVVHPDGFETVEQGKRLFLHHGDGLAGNCPGYRALKAFLRNPIWKAVWRLVHPDLGMKAARVVGGISRALGRPVSEPAPEYLAAADALLAAGKYDAVVHGHTHLAFVMERGRGTYVNSGEWIFHPRAVLMEDGEFRVAEPD